MKSSRLKIWADASRPKTLVAAFTPVIVGASLAFHDGSIVFTNTFIALLCAFLIQIGTNFANDYFDFIKGADTKERIGFTRATSAGLIPPKNMLRATISSMVLAFIIGLYLVFIGGWQILLIGLLSLLFGILYTGGPFPLGYNGLGDIFVFIFFGVVAVMTTYYINTFEWSEASFWASIAVGALCTNILVVNNLRDVEQDKKVGKRTLGVIFGDTALKLEYCFMLIIAYSIPFLLFTYFSYTIWIFLPFVMLPLSIRHVKQIWLETHKPNLNGLLEQTAKAMALFGILFSVGIIVG